MTCAEGSFLILTIEHAPHIEQISTSYSGAHHRFAGFHEDQAALALMCGLSRAVKHSQQGKNCRAEVELARLKHGNISITGHRILKGVERVEENGKRRARRCAGCNSCICTAASNEDQQSILEPRYCSQNGQTLRWWFSPQPGGPSNRTALGRLLPGRMRVPAAMASYTSGWRSVSSSVSSICCFCSSYPAHAARPISTFALSICVLASCHSWVYSHKWLCVSQTLNAWGNGQTLLPHEHKPVLAVNGCWRRTQSGPTAGLLLGLLMHRLPSHWHTMALSSHTGFCARLALPFSRDEERSLCINLAPVSLL